MTRRVRETGRLLANVLLLALVGAIVATQFEMLAAIRPTRLVGDGPAPDGQPGPRLVVRRPRVASRKALAITTATRNVAVGLVIAGSDFAGTPAVTAVVAYGLVSILGALGFVLRLGRADAIGRRGSISLRRVESPRLDPIHRSESKADGKAPLSLALPDQYPRLADRVVPHAGPGGDAG